MNKCHMNTTLFSMFVMALIIILMHNELGILQNKVIKNYNITYWHISHLTFFFCLGLLCPNRFGFYMSMGILWEIIERVYGKMTGKEEYWTSNGTPGQLTDIIMNATGYLLAMFSFN